jgi:hypothetical protein
MALVALHAVQTATVDRNHGALHIDEIILAQVLSFPIKDCATSASEAQTQQLRSDAGTEADAGRQESTDKYEIVAELKGLDC